MVPPKQEPGKLLKSSDSNPSVRSNEESLSSLPLQTSLPQQQGSQSSQQSQLQSQQQPNKNAQFSQADLNRIVLEYLNKKGYHKTESMLRIESSRIPGLQTPLVTPHNTQMATPSVPGSKKSQYDTEADVYSRGYSVLRAWCESSLDLYRADLEKVLFPVFIHCYLDLISKNFITELRLFFEKYSSDHLVLHNFEITKLSGISLKDHLEENEVAKIFRQNKYRLAISKTSLNLLLYFLHENEAVGGSLIIRIINQYLQPDITNENINNNENSTLREGEANPNEGISSLDLLINKKLQSTQQGITQLNSKPVSLGKFPMDPDFQKEVELELKQKDEDDKLNGKTVDKTLVDEFQDLQEMDKTLESPARELLPLPIKSSIDLKREIKYVQDSRSKIKLDAVQLALPSICMYTFHNTNDDMTCMNFNKDSTLIGAGFQDSYIRLWSIDGSPLRSVLKNDPFNQQQYQNSRRLIGHSGSVYGIDFSPDNKYMISSSEDKTVRLWSLDTYTSLVSYKSHSGPVWDVKFSPFGHYFATLSHDQTARLWSCDHINPLRIFAGHLNDVDCVEFHPNSTYVFTGSSDKTLRMWDVARGESVRIFIGHTSAINCLAVSPDGRWLASAGEDSVVNVWDISSGRRLKTMRGHGRTSIYSLAFSQEGSVLVSGGADNSIRVWDIKRGTNDSNPEPEQFQANTSISDNTTKVEEQQKRKREIVATNDHMGVYFTKKTPVYKIHFTRRNLCLAGGVFNS